MSVDDCYILSRKKRKKITDFVGAIFLCLSLIISFIIGVDLFGSSEIHRIILIRIKNLSKQKISTKKVKPNVKKI